MTALTVYGITVTGGFVGACLIAGTALRALNRAIAQRDAAQDMADADRYGWNRADTHTRVLAKQLKDAREYAARDAEIIALQAQVIVKVSDERDEARAALRRLEADLLARYEGEVQS